MRSSSRRTLAVTGRTMYTRYLASPLLWRIYGAQHAAILSSFTIATRQEEKAKMKMTMAEARGDAERIERNRRNGRNNKKKGTRNEHKSILRDIAAGAYVVRAGGSLGLFDYIALFPDFVRLVQVKSNRWPAHDEMAALSEFQAPHYGRKVIERWDDYAKAPIVWEIE